MSDLFQSPYGDLESGDCKDIQQIFSAQFQSPYGDLESGD